MVKLQSSALAACACVALGAGVPGRPVRAQDSLAARVDAIFAPWNRPDVPGCALGVIRDGRLIFERGYGSANLRAGTPLTGSTVFYLASVSKQFTAATLALLALDGRIHLEDDVSTFVPELPDYGARITLRDLVHHTSGLRDYLTLMDLAGMSLDEHHAAEEVLQLVSRQQAPNFTPGTRFLYSNTGYFLIPIIVERVTGTSIRAFADARIFQPLGMSRTHFHDDYRHEVDDRAMSYRRGTDGAFTLAYLETFDQVGSGGVLSTVRDLARWDANFYEPKVGGAQFLDLMHERGRLTEGDTLDYAFGLRLGVYKGLRTVSHGGSMMGFKTHLLRFPEQRFSVVCLCNLQEIDPEALATRVADVFLADVFARQLAPLTGEYYSPELNRTWILAVRQGDLVWQRADSAVTLQAAGRDSFRLPGGETLALARDASGGVTGFRLEAGRVLGVEFVRR